MLRRHPQSQRSHPFGPMLFLLLNALAFGLSSAGCITPQRMAPVNTTESGWTVRQGQAVWTENTGAPGIAGDLVLASHPDGRFALQFTKTPLPFVSAQRSEQGWQWELIPQKKIQSGHGSPPPHLLWLHLPAALNGTSVPAPLEFQRLTEGRWELINRQTGAAIAGFLAP